MSELTPREINDFWLRGVLPTAARAACVTQEELERLKILQRHLREYEKLRQRVRDKYLNGAPVVAGELSLEATETEQRSFSFESLSAVIGPEETQRLKNQLEPKRVIRLSVIDSPTSSES
ncbi:hypothetical protein AB1L42_22735 [Thalassoglobus sp. JC818]|uniref:hypothetical protein n=1 Tax=Thalassoglobus sp. JC818 TaxID=3232136 RepID=UPI003459EDCD